MTLEIDDEKNVHSKSVLTEKKNVVEVESENENDEDLLIKFQQEMEMKLNALKIENRILSNSVDELIKEKKKSLSAKCGIMEDMQSKEICNASQPLPLFLRGSESEYSPDTDNLENSFESSIVLDDFSTAIISSPEFCAENGNGEIGNTSTDFFLNINDMSADDLAFNQSALFDDLNIDFSDVTATAIISGRDYENKYISAMENIKQQLALDLQEVEELSVFHSKSIYDSDFSTDSSVNSNNNENEFENTMKSKMTSIKNDREKVDTISRSYEVMTKILNTSKNDDITNKSSSSSGIFMNEIYNNKTSNAQYLQEIEVLNTRLQYQIYTTRGAQREIGLLKNTIEGMKSDKVEDNSAEEIIPTPVKVSRYGAVNSRLDSTSSHASDDCLPSPVPLQSTPQRDPYHSRTRTSSPTLSCGTDMESTTNSVCTPSPIYGSGCEKGKLFLFQE